MKPDDDRAQRAEAQLEAFFESETLGGSAPSTPHLDDGTLARLAEGQVRPTAAQRVHLLECLECRDVLGVAAVQVPTSVPEPRWSSWWRWALLPGLAAAAAAAFVVFAPGAERPDGFRSRGGSDRYVEASVSFLRSDATGRAVLDPGAEVPLSAQLGFRYGNPAGEARTLTVLGFDGDKIYWYYPETADGAPVELAQGPGAVSKRLPFDIRLEERHRPGPLDLYAAFDVEPAALAAAIRSGSPPEGTVHLNVQLVAP